MQLPGVKPSHKFEYLSVTIYRLKNEEKSPSEQFFNCSILLEYFSTFFAVGFFDLLCRTEIDWLYCKITDCSYIF